jgi:serine/threonine-protein kinase mTOR
MLDYMFAVGLTESLRTSLTDLSANIPPLLLTIQERLLDMLSLVLFSRPYVHPGAPSKAQLYSNLAVKEVWIDSFCTNFDWIFSK